MQQRLHKAALRGALCFIALLVIPGVSEPAAAQQQNLDLQRLQDGAILLQTLHSDKPGGAARVTALFHSSAEAVWNIIGYCEYEFIYIRGLSLCEVLEPGLRKMLMRHRLRNSWYTPALEFVFEAYRRPGNVGDARLVEGDLKVLQAQWKLVPAADDSYVVVTHEVRIQPRIPAPRWLVRRSLRKDLPDMLACIRGLAKASGDNARVLADLSRCAGKVPRALLPQE